MDNLSAEMIQCKKDGFGCHYGKWKALQPAVVVKKEDFELPDNGRRVCEGCGSEFYYYGKGNKRYCSYNCYHLQYYRRKKAERMAANG